MNTIITQGLTETQANLRTIIGAFVTWYTAFWTLNAIALAWIFAKTRHAHEEHDTSVQRIVAVFFGLMNLCGSGTSVTMRWAIKEMSADIVALNKATLEAIPQVPIPEDARSVLNKIPYPPLFIEWSIWTCAGTLFFMALVWFFLGISPGVT